MKKILISSFDMEVGGVERSLISLTENFDYNKFDVDLMLYRHQGDFMHLLPKKVKLLDEVSEYSTFKKPIGKIIKEKHFAIGTSRILSKICANLINKGKIIEESGYYQMQLIWRSSLPFLPSLNKEYDVAISYLWPHYFVAYKVKAKKKIAWIHTDFSNIYTNTKMDLKVWKKFDYIIAVSQSCKETFIKKYKELKDKVFVIENLTSPEFIRSMALENIQNPLEMDNRFKLVTVARLSHAKGIDNAVKSLSLLINTKGYKKICWYVIGYGGDEEKIRKIIVNNNLEDNFILLGKKINPYPFINKCDLYVQPSRYEGKAVTVTEAKILGKPVLVTNYPTACSQIENGIDGIICDLSIEGLAKGIEMFYKNKELLNILVNNLKNKDFENSSEIEKIYELLDS